MPPTPRKHRAAISPANRSAATRSGGRIARIDYRFDALPARGGLGNGSGGSLKGVTAFRNVSVARNRERSFKKWLDANACGSKSEENDGLVDRQATQLPTEARTRLAAPTNWKSLWEPIVMVVARRPARPSSAKNPSLRPLSEVR